MVKKFADLLISSSVLVVGNYITTGVHAVCVPDFSTPGVEEEGEPQLMRKREHTRRTDVPQKFLKK